VLHIIAIIAQNGIATGTSRQSAKRNSLLRMQQKVEK
jgi:hypothetical protein